MNSKIITLNMLPLNKKAHIENLNCTGDIRRRLLDLGFVKNTLITPVFVSPISDPVAYEIRGSIIALRKEETTNIQVKL